MQLAFLFCILLHFWFWPKAECFCIFFLHHDATLAKEKVSQRVGSCIFSVFLCRCRVPGHLFRFWVDLGAIGPGHYFDTF
jgi:hypothetical protein